jgi:hypothetical protein
MADTHDDSTGWTTFYTYLTRRADKIVPLTAREQEAERLIFKEIHNGDLELRWLDIDGRVHIGLPRGWSGWYGRYDHSADAIRELPLPNARVLYQPQVRERQRNLDQPADNAVEPEHADLDISAHEIFPPDSNLSAVAGASPPASASPPPPFEPAPSEPASSFYGKLEANKAAEEGLTPDVLTPDAPDQVCREEHERDDAVAQTKTARATKTARGVKKARIKLLLPDLDKKGRLKPDMAPADIEKIVSPLYKEKWGAPDVPHRDTFWRAFEEYREERQLS